MCACDWCFSLVRGPGIFGEIEVYWNITPAIISEFVEISGKVIMRDRQSAATIQLMVREPEEHFLNARFLQGQPVQSNCKVK